MPISGQIWFHSNDSLHFGTFYLASSTIVRVFTEEDWTEVMYNNAEGCANYGYQPMCKDLGYTNCAARLDDVNDVTALEELACCCEEKSYPQPLSSYAYFGSLLIVGAWILMKLFIGIITTSMHSAQQAMNSMDEQRKKMNQIIEVVQFSQYTVGLYQRIFDMLVDFSGNGLLNESYLFKALFEVGINVDDESINDVYIQMASDNADKISFYNFVIFICTLKAKSMPKDSGTKPSRKVPVDHNKRICCRFCSKAQSSQKIVPAAPDAYNRVIIALRSGNVDQPQSLQKLQEVRHNYGASSKEYKEYLQSVLAAKQKRHSS